ncbi:MAG: thioredoxin fold domain-containing protein [Bacteroidota bacterium]
MRLFLSTALVVFGLSVAYTQEAGIAFAKDDWGTLLERSTKEGKLLFIDVYADWCGPCKMMDRNVYPDAEVGTFYNEHFISAKFNAEEGEGIAISDQYGVEYLPTYLFLDGKGELVYKAVGYYEPAQLIQLGEKAIDPAYQLTTLWANYEDGDRSDDLLFRLTEALYESGNSRYLEVAKVYLEGQKDLSTPENLMFMLNYGDGTDIDLFDFIIEN